jgi:hypothetical protein
LISLGLPLKETCAVVRDRNDKAITEPTLRKHFAKEIEVGLPGMKRWMGNFAYSTIFGTEVPEGVTPISDEKSRVGLLMMWLKTHGGWQETVRQEHANAKGPDGKPEPFVYVANKTDFKL